MKYLFLLLSFWGIGQYTYAQQTDIQCPNIAWHKPIEVGTDNYLSGNYYLQWLLPYELRLKYLNYHSSSNSHIGFNIATQKNGNILLASNFYNFLNIDNRSINNNHSKVTGVFMEGDEDGSINWLQTTYSTGRAAYQPNNINFEGINQQKHIILMHNQASSFNNQNYSSPFNNVSNRYLFWNATYSLVSLDANNQTINTFSVPHLRLQNHVVDSLGNIYLIGAFDTTITLGNQQYTPQRGIITMNPPFGRLTDMIVLKLNPQYQVQWAVPIIGRGDENDYLIKLDHELNIYLAGICYDRTLTIGNYSTPQYLFGPSMYITKLNNSGNVNWVKQIFELHTILDLEIDHNDHILLLTSTNNKTYHNNDTIGTYKIGVYNTLLLRYNPSNQTMDHLVLPGSGDNAALKMVLHPTDNYIYLAGSYTDTLFLPNNTYKISSSPHSSGFIARVASAEENLKVDWFHDIHSDSLSCVPSMSLAKDGGLYITGVSKGDYSFLGKNYTVNPNAIHHFYAKISGLNKEVNFDGTTYTAVETQATTYQWLDCNNNMQPISGATNRIFTPDQPGSYAVQMSNGACQVVSECLGTTSLPQTKLGQTQIFPNPFDQSISIQVPPTLAQQELHLQVTDLLGKTIWSHKGKAKELNTQIQEKSKLWPSNQMYQIQITIANTNKSATYKVMKQ